MSEAMWQWNLAEAAAVHWEVVALATMGAWLASGAVLINHCVLPAAYAFRGEPAVRM